MAESYDNPVLKPKDFVNPNEASASPLNKSAAMRKAYTAEWIKAEIAATAQLNPMEPYRKTNFDPKFFGVMG
jgi:hypothetical protein